MRSNTGTPVDRPHLGLPVHGPAQQILARVVPVERGDPRRVARQVSDMLAMLHIVEGNDGSVSRRRQPCATGGESDGTNRLSKTCSQFFP